MNLDNLRAELHDLAGEARPADLRDRALRTSHRIGRIRLALVAAATVVVVGVTSAGLALGGEDRALPEIATTRGPIVPPAGVTSAVYIDDLVFQSPVTVWSAAGLQRITRQWAGENAGDSMIRNTLTVSPDGTRLSWSTGSGLQVMSIAGAGVSQGGDDITLESENRDQPVVFGGCVWSPDSTRLLAGTRNPDEQGWITGWYTLADRSFAEVETVDISLGCAVETNGDWVAGSYLLPSRRMTIAVWNTRTGERREFLDGLFSAEVTGVSPDGARVVARIVDGYSAEEGPLERNRQGTFLIDSHTGEKLPVDTGGREVRQLYFQPDGDLVARVRDGGHHNLMIFAPDGRLILDAPEPPELLDSVLLRVVTP